MKRKLLFLCTANSCRSQMAEGLARQYLSDIYEPYSAGTKPGRLNPLAVKAMKEIGIDIEGQRSKSLNDLEGINFDLVVTLCDEASRSCPVYPGAAKVAHMGFTDPAAATGTEAGIFQVYRHVRDRMRDLLIPYLRSIALR